MIIYGIFHPADAIAVRELMRNGFHFKAKHSREREPAWYLMCAGCGRGHYTRNRENEDRGHLQLDGTLLHRHSHWSVPDVCCQNGHHGWGQRSSLPRNFKVLFEAKLSFFFSVAGLWLGIYICVTLQATFFIIFLWKLNWRKAAEEASDHTLILNEKRQIAMGNFSVRLRVQHKELHCVVHVLASIHIGQECSHLFLRWKSSWSGELSKWMHRMTHHDISQFGTRT